MTYAIDTAEKEALHSIIEIAHIHAKRLKYAIEKLSQLFPLSSATILSLSEEQFLLFELYTSRFAKLQDLMGNGLFPRLLEYAGESDDSMTLIDKLNRLEKLGLIESVSSWMEMRKSRNHLAHEYPEHPELTAEYLNQAYMLGVLLLEYLDRSVVFAKQQGFFN